GSGHYRLDVARVVVAVVAGQALAHVLQWRLRQQRHAVVALLAVDGGVVAKAFKGQRRKLLVDALDLLQAGDVRLGLSEPGEDGLKPRVDRVHVPGGDTHARKLRRARPSPPWAGARLLTPSARERGPAARRRSPTARAARTRWREAARAAARASCR